MKIKRYVVRDMQEAIQLIKQDLGPEAVIVSSYKVLAKGLLGLFSPRLLEVTAVLDDNLDIKLDMESLPVQVTDGANHFVKKQINQSKVQGADFYAGQQTDHYLDMINLADVKRKEGLADQDSLYSRSIVNAGSANVSLSGKDTGNLREESMRSPFDTMVNDYVETSLPYDFAGRWHRMLTDMDIQESIAERLLSYIRPGQHIPVSNAQDLYVDLYKQIIHLLEPAYRSRDCSRVLTFIGPTGVGKTTTLAKLATRFSLNDDKKVAMVAVNTYRIGVVEQLKAYGDFLGIPVDMVMTPSELAQVLENHKDKDYILIDTIGRSAHNAGQILELKGFLDVVEEPQDIFLVLSLTTKNRDLNKIAHEFRKTGYSKLIFSKADETETHGAILNLICSLGLPVAYLANGQGIPDDITEVGPKKIAKLLLKGVDPDEAMVNWN